MDFMNGASLSCDTEEQFVAVLNTRSDGYLYTMNMYSRHTKIT